MKYYRFIYVMLVMLTPLYAKNLADQLIEQQSTNRTTISTKLLLQNIGKIAIIVGIITIAIELLLQPTTKLSPRKLQHLLKQIRPRQRLRP